MKLRAVSTGLYIVSLALVVLGAAVRSKELLAAATVGVGLSYGLRSYATPREGSVDVMACYAVFASLWFGLSNAAAYWFEDSVYRDTFYRWQVDDFLFEAQVMGTLAVVIPILAYSWAASSRRTQFLPPLPKVGFDVNDRTILYFCLTLLVAGWVARFVGMSVLSLGTLGGFIDMGPAIAIFTMTSLWIEREPDLPRWTRLIGPVALVFDFSYLLMFSFMRVNLIWPVAAFGLPFLLHKSITPKRVASGLFFMVLFLVVFKPLGDLRRVAGVGADRLTTLFEQSVLTATDDELFVENEDETVPSGIELLARLSTMNQLSQVYRIVDEEGTYDGETLAYLYYVFIPRIIWADKPQIAPGQWFAEKIRRGTRIEEEDRFTNAINMTIPGELFLNFGWIGCVAGLALLGLLYLMFWESAGFFQSTSNPMGHGFAFILLAQSMFNGSHLGAILNIVLWYMAWLGFSWLFKVLRKRFWGGADRPAQEPRYGLQPLGPR